ncbi:hypothetical protein TUBRATIS_28580 [Tubulinosema ratisbonensis]|uniref:Uncharacterized protein n=1 Tax=Tubulinosema ratisbonensis TaxID=291195 RepID=A0A437AI18_9MICR|nr:hypothetical protein TUBRATIS_28580 [Tubulinosema ratisbonensis]
MLKIFFIFFSLNLTYSTKVILEMDSYYLRLVVTKTGPLFKMFTNEDKKQYKESICKLIPFKDKYMLKFRNGILSAGLLVRSVKHHRISNDTLFGLENTVNGMVITNFLGKCIQIGDEVSLGTYKVELGDCVPSKFQLFNIKRVN